MIILILSQLVNSCKSLEYNQNSSGEEYAKRMILKISDEEKITKIANNYLHVKIEKLINGYYLSQVSINPLKPTRYSSNFYYLGFEVYLYSSEPTKITKLDYSPFFVPDSRNWDFLFFIRDNEIITLKQLTTYGNIDIEEDIEIKL
jgi:hypothetical protein